MRWLSGLPLLWVQRIGWALGWLTWWLSPRYRLQFKQHSQQAGYNEPQVRAAGSGIAYNVGRFITAAGVLAAGGLFVALGGSYTRIGAACGVVYLLGIVAIRWAPDTTGRGLIHSRNSSPSTP